jgi:putative nucleotidyltransferase with HDIG domain
MITAEAVRVRVHSLPSLPTTVVALGQAVADDRCTMDRIMGILAKDPPLSATILRLANSVVYGGARQVTDLRSAVQRLGFDAMLNLGRTAAIIRNFRGANHLDALQLWQHSVAVGLTAKGICRMLGRRNAEEEAFLTGLLHDIGKIALDRCFTEEYAPVLAAVAAGREPLGAEREFLTLTHADVGGLVARHWNFADRMVEVIRTHHEPPTGAFLPHLIHLCDLLVRARIPNCPADEGLAFALEELPSFQEVFGAQLAEGLDLERLTFGIDDELDHAVAFVKLAFQD